MLIDTVGADPEVFLIDALGTPRSAEGLIGGTKKDPKPMEGFSPGFMVQEDNVAAEYNIPPAKGALEFSRNVEVGLKYVEKLAKKHKLKVACVSAMNFPMKELLSPQASNFGCDPDYNVWLQKPNPRPSPHDAHTLRTAAGHIHLGTRFAESESPTEMKDLVVKMLDLRLGVPSILVTQPSERRKLYGKAGAMRYKPYGLEYRTLDNFWLPIKSYRMHIFQACMAIQQLLSYERWFHEDLLEAWGDEIQEVINAHNKDLALKIVDKLNIPLFPSEE